jgi:hypothetical protein
MKIGSAVLEFLHVADGQTDMAKQTGAFLQLRCEHARNATEKNGLENRLP